MAQRGEHKQACMQCSLTHPASGHTLCIALKHPEVLCTPSHVWHQEGQREQSHEYELHGACLLIYGWEPRKEESAELLLGPQASPRP